jgi:ABC-type spermidine/putrescine transport system permease subunit II
MISASIFKYDRAQNGGVRSVILLSKRMIYFKSILAGLGAALLSLVLLAVAAMVIAHQQFPGIGAVSVSASSVLIVGAITFAAGFAWAFRRWSTK